MKDDPIVLVSQPTAKPTRKVAAGTVAGALAAILSWAAGQFAGLTLPPGIEGAATILISFLIAYVTRDVAQEVTIVESTGT